MDDNKPAVFLLTFAAALLGLFGWLIWRDMSADKICASAGFQQKVEINNQFYCVEKAVWIGAVRP